MGGNESSTASDESLAGRAQPADGERTFDAPWQARAFAVAVAMTREGDQSWEDFQERLATEVERAGSEVPADAGTGVAEEDPEKAYYEQWLGALSRLLIESGTLTADEIAARTREFADGERTAEEWVDGERDHDHGEGHAHDHGGEHGHAHDHDH